MIIGKLLEVITKSLAYAKFTLEDSLLSAFKNEAVIYFTPQTIQVPTS